MTALWLGLWCAVAPIADPADDPPAPADPVDDAPRDMTPAPDHPPAPGATPPAAPAKTQPRKPPIENPALAAIQCAGGCGVLALLAPLSIACGTLTCLGGPFLLGYAITWIGDALGGGRAPAITPIVTAYVGVAISIAIGSAVGFGFLAQGAPQGVALPFGLFAGAIGLPATVMAATAAYHLTEVEKDALDDGSEEPDFMQPRVPTNVRKARQKAEVTKPPVTTTAW